MAVGYDNATNEILLFGAIGLFQRSLLSFNLSIWNEQNSFIDHGNNSLSTGVGPFGQAYVQTKAVIYIIGGIYGPDDLYSFDISTRYINKTVTNLPTKSLMSIGCLASIEDWIIYTCWNDTYFLNTSNLLWRFAATPVMLGRRSYHSCMVESDEGYLYVIGGLAFNDRRDTDSIEKLYVKDIPNIYQYNFTILKSTLTSVKISTKAILYKTDIYVVGGYPESDCIDVIDTRTDSVKLWGRLYEGIYYISPIIVADRMYVFGGWANGSAVDYWQYFNMTNTSITGSFTDNQQSNNVLISIIMIVSVVLTVMIIVGIYKWFRRKHKLIKNNKIIDFIKADDPSDIYKNNRNNADDNIERIQRIVESNSNAGHDSDKYEDMYDDNNNDKTKNEVIIFTKKDTNNDAERESENVGGDDAFNVPPMEQHEGENHENLNVDSEGCQSSFQTIIKNEKDIIETTATNDKDSPGFV